MAPNTEFKKCTSYDSLSSIVREKFETLGYKGLTIIFKNGNNAGDGYASEIIKAEIKGIMDGKEQTLDAIIKTATKNKIMRHNVSIGRPFKREIFFYTQIVPIYEKLQDDFEVKDKCRLKFAKCYAAHEEPYEEFIILENIKTENCDMAERLKLDYVHASIALDSLAKLHALSYAFERFYPEKFNEFIANYPEIFLIAGDGDEYDPTMLKKFFQTLSNKAVDMVKNDKHRDRLYKATRNIYEDVVAVAKAGASRVITHGDYWTNNIFYNFENGRPINAVPIDYQLSRYASPVLDITYLLLACTEAEFRRKHYEQFLEEYYSSLNKALKRFSLNVEDVYPKELFSKELILVSKFGLAFSFLFMVAIVEGNATDLLEVFSMEKDQMKTSSYVEERTNDIVVDAISYGYI